MQSAIDHPFYRMLDGVLSEAGFDGFVDYLCAAATPSAEVRPPVYFRMLLVGYFEDIDSQRGIAWRCRDSRSLAEFLGCRSEAPSHRCLAAMARLLSAEVHEQAFDFALKLVAEKRLFDVQTLLAAEANYREADAAMRGIRRLEALGDYKKFLLRLAQEAAIENPVDDSAHVCARKDSGPDQAAEANGRARLPDKSEHVIDLKRPAPASQDGRTPIGGRPGVVPDVAKSGANGDLPGWAVSYALDALRCGQSVANVEEGLVLRGLDGPAAACVVGRCLQLRTVRRSAEMDWERDPGHVLALVAGSFILGCAIVAIFGTLEGVALASVFIFLLLLLFLVGRIGWLTFLWWSDRS
jgi:hypothetical protein